ncbi:carbohydrate ABC transporter substrate-binding protein (CUT1 family) [Scopulibacillus darangshiensis]|uniref:Carbohydrate ABC transporter substrate-binding protein (CUT1 family) n=1 Tax=Scopulibacillus darangshiensis TaxID=442528 RepID=A0A4R2NM29_9BACL|nr:sugar ABC transporter substrate-binding protein [Scopulibacillus darangshiensis]TCP22338.1 carbohydrate ABC transporter substrate-binding protein (CUT1 family) [Scopulibacillus darangshiensis]
MKKLCLILVSVFLLCLVSACSNSESGSGSSKVTLRYGIWDKNQKPAMQKIVDEFQKKHPEINVKIEVTPYDQYWTKLETAATGKSLPDVFWMNGPNFIKYSSNDMLMPINNLTKKDKVNLGNYPKALVNLYTFKGKTYGIPKDFDTIGLFYNKKLFDEAHIPYPDETWDWDKLKAAAKKLTNKEKGVWGIAARMENQAGFYNTIYQNGGYVISDDKKKSGYDQPETIGGLKFWIDMIKDGSSPTQAQMTETTPSALFESGKVAMIYDGSWMQIEYEQNEYTKDKVDVAPLPKGKKKANIIHGLANVVAANTQHKKEAQEFLAFLGSKKASLIQAKSGTVIPAYNGTQKLWVKSNPNVNLQVFIDSAKYAVPLPSSKNTSKWWDDETKILNKAWGLEIPVDEAAKTLAKKMNKDLAEEH